MNNSIVRQIKNPKTNRINNVSISSKNIKAIRLTLEPYNMKSVSQKKKISLTTHNKNKPKKVMNTSLSNSHHKLFKLTDSSINDFSNSTYDTFYSKLSNNKRTNSVLKNQLKSRNKQIRKKLFLDISNLDSDREKTHRKLSNFRSIPLISSKSTKASSRINKTISTAESANMTLKLLKERCLNLKESSEIIKNDMNYFPSYSKDIISSKKQKIKDLDETIVKKEEPKIQKSDIYSDIVNEKERGKNCNEFEYYRIQSATYRLMKEVRCVESVNPYTAYHSSETVGRIFTIKKDHSVDESNLVDHQYFIKRNSTSRKKTVPKKESKAMKFMKQTEQMVRLVELNYKLKRKVMNSYRKCKNKK